MNNFSISTQLNKGEYIKLNYQLTYSKAWILFMSIFGVLFVGFSIVIYMMHKYAIFDSDLYSFGIVIAIPGVMLLITPYLTSALAFKSNQMLQEIITYEFTEHGVNVVGESFNSNFIWDKLYKVKGINGFLLLYQSKRSANIIKIGPDNFREVKLLKDFLAQSNFKIKMQI
jgi:hypothetical protein